MRWQSLWNTLKTLIPEPPKVYQEILPALAVESLPAIKATILNSPFLTKNVLNYNFDATQGFSIIFKTPEIKNLEQKFPAFAPFLALIIQPEYNLYYLNALVIENQGHVERHIDHSIRGYHTELPYPRQVSVLYVEIPQMQGGDLVIYNHKDFPLKQIQPQTNKLLQFPGYLKHSITPIQGLDPQQQRISLVCEQYALSPRELSYIPDYTIKSMANFSAFLAEEVGD